MANNDNVVPTQVQGESTRMNLQNNVTINGREYRKGMNVEIPKNQADDIARIDYDASVETANLMRQRTFGGEAR